MTEDCRAPNYHIAQRRDGLWVIQVRVWYWDIIDGIEGWWSENEPLDDRKYAFEQDARDALDLHLRRAA